MTEFILLPVVHETPLQYQFIKAITDPSDAIDCVKAFCKDLTQECFFIITMNVKGKVINQHVFSIGLTDQTLVRTREVYSIALRDCAASIICIHNHPSGDKEISKVDIDVTNALKEAGKILALPMLDHIIIGDNGYTSMHEMGYC